MNPPSPSTAATKAASASSATSRPRPGRTALCGVVALSALLVCGALPARAVTPPKHYPVVYNIASAITGVTNPTAPSAGANNWSCKPSAAHPEPVVLVHGAGANMGLDFGPMSPLLADNGYCVFALTYGTEPGENFSGGLVPMEQSSHQLAALVNKILAATGATKVDLVGHSEGTVMPQYYLKFLAGAAKVDKYVALAPLYHGTTLFGVSTLISMLEQAFPALATLIGQLLSPLCGSCLEFVAGSPFLKHLYADGVYAVPGVTYTTIMTRYDEAVVPYTSGMLNAPNATNIIVQDQCPIDYAEHDALAWDPVTAQDILNALDPAHPHPVPCTLVLPLIGEPLG
jgi:pimeloyl-ACP methyl ester carboxylesterase